MKTPEKLWVSSAEAMRSERFSVRRFDAGGSLTHRVIEDLLGVLEAFGAVHVTDTGLTHLDDLTRVLGPLGFSGAERFTLGGRTSEAWQTKWAAEGVRRMDYYPPEHYLLPNNEVQYQRCGPARVMFFCQTPPGDGGRTFLHAAHAVEAGLRARGPVGEGLLDKIARHGLTIETGFLHKDHPARGDNYFQSWQERFGTDDPAEAMANAQRRRDEIDRCWWHTDAHAHAPTLMTSITLRGFKRDASGRPCLRFPRIAMDAPAARNGYRRFPLGDGSAMTADEEAILREVYLATREGADWRRGELILFDNVRYGHSREPFTGPREVFVAMAGTVWEDPIDAPAPTAPASPALPRLSHHDARERYLLPPEAVDPARRYSARIFDAGGSLSPDVLAAVRSEFDRHGALHVTHTGLRCEHEGALPDAVLSALGFGLAEAFPWGGMSSGRTTRRALSPALRATDDYPPERWLLPHNEVLYQRTMPARLLFFSAHAADPQRGGRTFVHDAARFEAWLRARGADGRALIDSLRTHGFLIEMGFIDARHPDRARNYFRAWQERFDSDDPDVAIARARASTMQFDACWWREEPAAAGVPTLTLMTRICIPAFLRHPVLGRDFMLFPRIALDGPGWVNGHRIFSKGNGEPLTDDESDLLLHAFLATREGVHYGAGDLLLVDNVRFGHSREAYEGPRSLGVAMAGRVFTNDVPEGQRT